MARPHRRMSEQLAWAKWWACPWLTAHHQWQMLAFSTAPVALYRSHPGWLSTALEVEPSVPCAPTPALLQLLLASMQQRELMLLLIDSVCRATGNDMLSDNQRLWCQRLAKALARDQRLISTVDPLHYLRAWLEPLAWQRFRLSFARQRVLDLEKQPRLHDSHARLNTLWQAVIWRATSITGDDARPQPGENARHALPTQD